MPFISITIEGLDQVINGINATVYELENAKQQIHQQATDFMANQMRANVHVITGQLKASITTTATRDSGTVEVLAPYAIFENKRVGGTQGPHDFADRAEQATIQMLPQIILQELSRLF